MANNSFRPYGTALINHDNSLATIILHADKASPEGLNKGTTNKNFLRDFSGPIATSAVTGSASSGVNIPDIKLDGTSAYYGIFNNFSLSSVSESRDQIVKVQNHFGGNWSAFFFGDKPRVFRFNGLFLDGKNYPHYQEFVSAYSMYLSGRKCIENNFKMTISYDGKIIRGYMLDMSTVIDSNNTSKKGFSFSILVEKESWARFNTYENEGQMLNKLSNADRYLDTYVYGSELESDINKSIDTLIDESSTDSRMLEDMEMQNAADNSLSSLVKGSRNNEINDTINSK